MGQARRRKQQRTQLSVNDKPMAAWILETYLSMEDQKDAAMLLCSNIPNWSRRYNPLSKYSTKVRNIEVSCAGDLAMVAIVPISNAPLN